MENVIFSEEIYREINNLKVPSLIAKKLKGYSAEFKAAYNRYGNKIRNRKFREDKNTEINERRREERARVTSAEIRPIEHKVAEIDLAKVDKTAKRGYKKVGALGVEKLKESTKSNYKAVIRTLYSKYKKVAIAEENSIMRMLEGERYKANEIYRDFKFIIVEIEDIAKNNGCYLSNIYSIFSLFKQKRLMGGGARPNAGN